MAVRLPFSRDVMLNLYSAPLYDEAAVRQLLLGCGCPNAAKTVPSVTHSLNEMTKTFAFDLFTEVRASGRERNRQAQRLADACGKVLAVLGVEGGGDLLPMFAQGGLFAAASLRGEASGKAATMNAIRAVDLLRQDALKMLEVEGRRRRMKPPKSGRPENAALTRLVRDLSCLYEQVWNSNPGVSNGAAEQPTGPFMRLMLDVTERLKARGLRFYASASSLRKVWQRIDASEKMPITKLARDFDLAQRLTQ